MFKFTFARLSTTSLEQNTSQPLERSNSWISFPSFLDDSFNLSHTSLSLDCRPLGVSALSDITQDVNNRQSQTLNHSSIKRSDLRPLEEPHIRNSEPNTTMSAWPRPRYMTPTLASQAQNNTPQLQPRPTTPSSVASITGKNNWMANAGRRLGITTPRSRRDGRVSENAPPGTCLPDESSSVIKKPQVSFPSLNMIRNSFPAADERQEQQDTITENRRKRRIGHETRRIQQSSSYSQ